MTRTVSLSLVAGLVACGSPVSTSPGADASSGGDSTSLGGDTPTGSSTAPNTTGFSDGSSGSSGVVESGSSSSTTGAPEPQCDVQVVESFVVSPERFGALTLANDNGDAVVLGAWGWVLAGSADMPTVERVVDPASPLLAGRFGPGGGLALAEVSDQSVTVHPIDDPPSSVTSTIANGGTWVVGDIDADGRDDLVVTAGGRIVAWRSDAAGGFEELAASEDGRSAQLYGHMPATPFAPPAVLVADEATGKGIVGFEVEDDVLAKAYTVALSFVWWARGVQPSRNASREVLYAARGGLLIDPKDSEVGFVVAQDGEWLRRRHRFAAGSATEPRALDLDQDGTLDAVFATVDEDRLVGACTDGAFDLVPCLDVALEGTPESIAVDGNAQVFVATEDAGLWVYRLGRCE